MRKINFASNLKLIRNKRNLTQEELGKLLGYEKQTISNWEKNKRMVNMYDLVKISEILNVTLDELMFGNEHNDDIPKSYMPTLHNINKPGYYNIINNDFKEITGLCFEDTDMWGMALGLRDEGFIITDIYANGFGVYLKEKDVERFNELVSKYIDSTCHCERESLHWRKYTDKFNNEKCIILDAAIKKLCGGSEKNFVWYDNEYNIRGYGNTKEECIKQVEEQSCTAYKIIKKSCENCEFNNGVCSSMDVTTANKENTYGMDIEKVKTMFPDGCTNWEISFADFCDV